MQNLEKNKFFKLLNQELETLQQYFDAFYTTNEEILENIKSIWEKYNYLIDPHTATTIKYLKINWNLYPTIFYSTAEWTKFPETILIAYNEKYQNLSLKEMYEKIKSITGISINEKILKFLETDNSELVKDLNELENEIINFIKN